MNTKLPKNKTHHIDKLMCLRRSQYEADSRSHVLRGLPWALHAFCVRGALLAGKGNVMRPVDLWCIDVQRGPERLN